MWTSAQAPACTQYCLLTLLHFHLLSSNLEVGLSEFPRTFQHALVRTRGAQRVPQAVLGHDHLQEEKLHSVSVRAKLLERPKKVSRMFSHHYCGHYDARWRGRRTRYQFDPLNKNDLYQMWPKSRRLTGISIYLLAVSIMHLRGYFG